MTTEIRPAATADPIDPARIKQDFPILDQEIHGHRLVYLDSASTSQKPAVVIDAVDEYYRGYNANIHRGIYQLAEKSTAAWEGARVKVAKLIGAQDPHEIVFVRNATEAINLVAYSWGRKHISRGDVIVLTEMEHHANLVPWQILAQEKDADLEFIPITDDGILRQDVFDVLLNLKPKLVAFTHVSNTLGTINPVEAMTRKAPRRARSSSSTGPRRCRTSRSTSARSAATSTCSAATRCSRRRARACSGAASRSSTRCRRSWVAAT
jgi:cysteine desulfurase / selenocysteine lyase